MGPIGAGAAAGGRGRVGEEVRLREEKTSLDATRKRHAVLDPSTFRQARNPPRVMKGSA